ncbi:MAG: glutamate--tRNA ligase, partial [Clostridia bacterium]|nr:glutamate--tRNA ligase [Clostridia bacterium]
LPKAKDIILSINDFTVENIHDSLVSEAENLGYKGGQMLFLVRAAVTGVQSTPGGAVEMIDILGKEETLNRLTVSINQLND